MSTASEPLLRWLRARMDARGENTASLASALGRSRGEVRRLMTGSIPMTVDDLLRISEVLEVSGEDLGLDPQAAASLEASEEDLPEEGPHWDNQPSVLAHVAFDHGIDVMLLAVTDDLPEDWGGPEAVRAKYAGQELPIGLDAAYHHAMDPVFGPDALEITLSFDVLYRCRLPWHAIRRVVFTPLRPEPPEAAPKTPDGPHLRLV